MPEEPEVDQPVSGARSAEPPDEHQGRALLDEVLRIVSKLAEVPVTPDHRGALVGFLARCRLLLFALAKMVDSGTDDAGDVLTRSIYEHVVTGLWLVTDPTGNYQWLRQAYVQDWVMIRNEHRQLFPEHPFLAQADVDELLVEEPHPRKLPPVIERARVAGLHHFYVVYRIYCLSVHGTLGAAMLGLNRTPERNLQDARIGLSSHLVLRLTEATRSALDMEADPEIAVIDKAILRPALAKVAPDGCGQLYVIGPSSVGKGALSDIAHDWMDVDVIHIDEEFPRRERTWPPIEARLLELERSGSPALVDIGAGTQDQPELATFLASQPERLVLVTDIPRIAFERNVMAGHRTADQLDNYMEVEYVRRTNLYALVPDGQRVDQRGRGLAEGPSDEFCQLVARLFMEAARRAASEPASA